MQFILARIKGCGLKCLNIHEIKTQDFVESRETQHQDKTFQYNNYGATN